MIDFPTNPTVGQIHTVGVKSWRWNGVAWDSKAVTDTQVVRAESAADRAEAAATQIGTAAAFTDSNPIVKGSADATKQLKIEVDGFTTGATHTLTAPNRSGTIATLDDVTDAGDVRLIASVAPTAVANIDMLGLFSDQYEHYLITLVDVASSTGAPILARVITDESTVVTSGSYYGGPTPNQEALSGGSNFILATYQSNPITRASGTVRVQRAASTFFDVSVFSHLVGNGIYSNRAAYLANVANVTGLRIYPNNATFNAGGRINVYAFSKT